MYCPYCKDAMVMINGELYCKLGNCYFSKKISNRFIEKIKGLEDRRNKSADLIFKKDSKFYCVNCGDKMQRIDDLQEICTTCGFDIDKSEHYHLIEFNPHK